MEIRELLLPEFETEMKKTRTVLERVPENALTFKAHEKSMAMGNLAGHLAQIPVLTSLIVDQPELDFATSGLKPHIMESRQQTLKVFDGNVQNAREAIRRADDFCLQQDWKLRMQDHIIGKGSRYEMIRSFIINHMVHHRAQLGIYLRLNGVPVPSIYGPSADEA
jgi:uncharacterized damage-inducible protein DinB